VKPPLAESPLRPIWQWQYGGDSERVEADVSDRWRLLFPEAVWGDTVDRNASNADFGNADNSFRYRRIRMKRMTTFHGDTQVLYGCRIEGKWWRSSGRASVLTIPKDSTLLPNRDRQ
jgi:hypothetical protein